MELVMGTPLPAEPWDLPAEDDVAETLLHLLIRILLLGSTRRWFETRGARALVGSDQFVYWVRRNPHRVVAPDLYVVLGEDPDRSVRVWKTWEDGVPDLAVEVVSEDVEKDYVLAPARYAELGVRELVVFDPLADGVQGRVSLQLYRRDATGTLTRADVPLEDRLWSEVLGCWLRRVPDAATGEPRLRLATGERGETVFPTTEEAERAAKEAERAENSALRAEVERLKEQLARRGSSS